jgi:subtilisin family serine protease
MRSRGDINKKNAPFSSKGPKAEICAAGTDVYSDYMDNAYATLSGTSMATPVIAGAVALLQGKAMIRYKRYLSPEEIRLLLHMYAEDLGVLGRDPSFGYGLFSFGRVETGGERSWRGCPLSAHGKQVLIEKVFRI